MRIGIMGAPESGKTEFAKALAKDLRKGKEHPRKEVQIIDGYVDALMKIHGMAYGVWATYPMNLQVAFARLTEEQRAAATGATTSITVGTLYETTMYSAIKLDVDSVLNKSDHMLLAKGRAYMECLGAIESEIGAYEVLYYLPYSAAKREVEGRSYNAVINEKIPEITSGYFRTTVELTGTLKDKVKDAKKYIATYEAWEAKNEHKADKSSVDDGQTVQRSGDAASSPEA